jgi:hypothetical protein
MADTPVGDALKKIPTNSLEVGGEVSTEHSPAAKVTFEREKGDTSVGGYGEISKDKGWSVGGFFRKYWK